ncbi:unnamed protein product, partial [Heterosigma akashiwo]
LYIQSNRPSRFSQRYSLLAENQQTGKDNVGDGSQDSPRQQKGEDATNFTQERSEGAARPSRPTSGGTTTTAEADRRPAEQNWGDLWDELAGGG